MTSSDIIELLSIITSTIIGLISIYYSNKAIKIASNANKLTAEITAETNRPVVVAYLETVEIARYKSAIRCLYNTFGRNKTPKNKFLVSYFFVCYNQLSNCHNSCWVFFICFFNNIRYILSYYFIKCFIFHLLLLSIFVSPSYPCYNLAIDTERRITI